MRICVIGNSHCGSLATAWREHYEGTSADSLTFFAMRGRTVTGLRVKNGQLVPNDPEIANTLAFTSGGRRKVNPELYDHFLVYGLIRQPPATERDDGHSLSLREAVLADRFEKSLARRIVKRLRQVTDKPIDVAPAPFQFAPEGEAPSKWKLSYEEEARIYGRFFDGLGARFWPQPSETVVPGGTRATRPEFSEGSERLAVDQSTMGQKHPFRDVKHSNQAFGRIWLRMYLDGLK